MAVNPEREKALADYRKKLMEHKEVDARLKDLRGQLKDLTNQYDKSENDLKALQSVGQIVGEVLKQLTVEKFIASNKGLFVNYVIVTNIFDSGN